MLSIKGVDCAALLLCLYWNSGWFFAPSASLPLLRNGSERNLNQVASWGKDVHVVGLLSSAVEETVIVVRSSPTINWVCSIDADVDANFESERVKFLFISLCQRWEESLIIVLRGEDLRHPGIWCDKCSCIHTEYCEEGEDSQQRQSEGLDLESSDMSCHWIQQWSLVLPSPKVSDIPKKTSVTRLEIAPPYLRSIALRRNSSLSSCLTNAIWVYMQESGKYKECVVEPPGRCFLSVASTLHT